MNLNWNHWKKKYFQERINKVIENNSPRQLNGAQIIVILSMEEGIKMGELADFSKKVLSALRIGREG